MSNLKRSESNRKLSSSKAIRSKHHERVRRNINPNEEKRRALRMKRLKIRRKQAIRNRIIAVFALLMLIYLSFRAVAGVIGFIEHSREMQRGSTETIATYESFPSPALGFDAPSIAGEAELQGEIEQDTASSDNASSATEGSDIKSESDGTGIGSDKQLLSGGRYIDIEKPMIAFTFDDGPDPELDMQLTAALEQVGGRGTFFVIGSRSQKYAEDLKAIHERGHEIANHSWSHDTGMSKRGEDYIREEFIKTDELLSSITGEMPRVYRLPGGIISDAIKRTLKKPMIYWSIDTEDWKFRRADAVIESMRGKVKDGDIVLMHALYPSTVEACKTIIPELSSQGYQFVTVSELIELRGKAVEGGSGKQYRCFPPLAESSRNSEMSNTTADAPAPAESDNSETVSGIGTEQPSMPDEIPHSYSDSPLNDGILVGPGAAPAAAAHI